MPISDLLDPLFRDWIPRSFNTAGPGYLAFIPGGGIFPAALADLIADGTNRYTGVWQAAPALVQLEANVLDWFRDWMGFPSTTRGLFTTGGSMSIFNAILAPASGTSGPRLDRAFSIRQPRLTPRWSNPQSLRASSPIASVSSRSTPSSACGLTNSTHKSSVTGVPGWIRF